MERKTILHVHSSHRRMQEAMIEQFKKLETNESLKMYIASNLVETDEEEHRFIYLFGAANWRGLEWDELVIEKGGQLEELCQILIRDRYLFSKRNIYSKRKERG